MIVYKYKKMKSKQLKVALATQVGSGCICVLYVWYGQDWSRRFQLSVTVYIFVCLRMFTLCFLLSVSEISYVPLSKFMFAT